MDPNSLHEPGRSQTEPLQQKPGSFSGLRLPDLSKDILCFRDKNRLPVTPILSSVLRLVRYHLGTVAKGSFIITLVKVPRLVLMYIHNQLKGRV